MSSKGNLQLRFCIDNDPESNESNIALHMITFETMGQGKPSAKNRTVQNELMPTSAAP